MKIYTKTGDLGKTGLASGQRVSKGNLRIDAYGDLDELNCQIGILKTGMIEKNHPEFKRQLPTLAEIQNILFQLGSIVATSRDSRDKLGIKSIDEKPTENLEKNIDTLSAEVPPLKNFILPGGSMVSSYGHICRTVCRRAERKLVLLAEQDPEEIPGECLIFLNRLSDYFFTLARWLNYSLKENDVVWTNK